MVNIYGPQDNEAKRNLWAKLLEFGQSHQGRFILFGDMNVVRDENERSDSLIDSGQASNEEHAERINLMQEFDSMEKIEAMDLA
ncbi:RNA-directed DNA polymerase, eukaryota [Tanacetum coccineum]